MDVEPLCRAAVRLGDVIVGAGQSIASIDLNPVIVGAEGEGLVVVDALDRAGTAHMDHPGRRRSLALKPATRDAGAGNHGRPAVRETAGGVVIRTALVAFAGVAVLIAPRPAEVTPEAWRLLAIFVGHRRRPDREAGPVGAMVLFGVTAAAVTGALTPAQALGRLRRPDGLDGASAPSRSPAA